jgi:hypothetical protein
MNLRLITLAAAVTIINAGFARAEDAGATTFESCIDAKGRTLPAVADTALPTLVATVEKQGQASIHYNPSLLPNLKPLTRLFFFADECARNALGYAAKTAVSAARAQQADCLGLVTMQDNGLMKTEELPDLQSDLKFSEAEWAMLPGPARSFDLAACHSSGVVKLPVGTTASPGQSGWDTCVRRCAGPLLACGNHCLETYQKCVTGCGERPEK